MKSRMELFEPVEGALHLGRESWAVALLPAAGSVRRWCARTGRLAVVLCAGHGAWFGCACVAGSSQTERAIAQMRADMARLEADHARVLERVAVLEAAQARGPSPNHEAVQSSSSLSSVPTATAMAPSAEWANGAGVTRGAARDEAAQSGASAGRDDGTDPTSSSTSSADARRQFEAAVSQVRTKSYDKALDTLTAFLVRYPDHPSAAHAMYLRGECLYRKSDYSRASQEFEGLLARFPFFDKASDALLKLGLCRERLGQLPQAAETFAELRQRYPNSAAARQLPRR